METRPEAATKLNSCGPEVPAREEEFPFTASAAVPKRNARRLILCNFVEYITVVPLWRSKVPVSGQSERAVPTTILALYFPILTIMTETASTVRAE